ncbi:D-alanyl-D-alanine carboxypeptidase [Streptomyces althioticus]|uniref:D-alanyl-D-alanine carboxypeptidase n=1 Tax=Streptomyces althioticus TaxID=83380 RepID=UPI0033D999AB
MAGESPDRSKQRESSAEQTSGSAGPVPEKQDPRLAVARGAGDAAGGKKADTATRVLSVREVSASAAEDADPDAADAADAAERRGEGAGGGDGRLREAVAAWVRSAEPKPEDASEGSSDASGVDGDEEVVEPGASGGGTREGGTAGEDAGPSGDSTEDAAPSVDDAPSDEAATAADGGSGDAPETDAAKGEASEDEDAERAAPEDATAEGAAPEGEDTDGAAPEGVDAENEAGEGEGAADKTDAPKAAAGVAAAPTGDRDAGAGEAGVAGERTGADDGEADAEDTGKVDDAKADAGTDGGTDGGEAAAEADGGKRDESGADAKTPDGKGTGKTVGGTVAATKGDAEGGKATAQDGNGTGDNKTTAGGTKSTGNTAPGTAAAAKDGDEDGDGKTPGADAEGADEAAGPGAPVDQPTAVFRAPRPSAPAVDQPTTMLKLGDAAARTDARAAEAERSSKFVALKPDPAIGRAPRQGGPAPAESTTFLPQVGPERTTQQPLPPKPPLDLLAELTNTPPPPQTPLRTAVRRIKIWTPLVLLLVIVFAVVQNFRPLPTPTLVLTAQDSYTFEGGKPQIPWPENGQAALDVEGIGTFGSSGEQKPVPIASVAKVMTAYVILRDHPLKSGADGPKIEVDKLAEEQSDAGQESTVNVTEGDAISEREAVEAILIASANNVARLLARWDAGSEEAFVEKMNEAAEGLGMSDTTYTDPSGLNDTTVSTAVDQVKLARAAMQQPVFREVAAMMEYTDYKGDKHGNWNRLVGRDDVVGIKTGTTTSALGNLSFAAKKDVDGEVHRIVGAVLRQPEGGEDNTILSGALDAGHKLILAGQDALRAETILKKGAVVGYADDGLGGRTPVVVTEDVKAVGWAGLEVKLTFAGTELPHTAEAGTEVGTLTVGDGRNGAVKVPVALKADLVEPGFTDKLTRVA